MDQRSATCPNPKCGAVVPLPQSMVDDADPGGLIVTCPKCHEQFDAPPGIGVSRWWRDPDYLKMKSLGRSALYIVTRLYQKDTGKFRSLSIRVVGTSETDPAEISTPQWRQLLTGMGAIPAEVEEVLTKLGR